jgi:hypothetical protein
MEPQYFQDGNFIYECKSSPERLGLSVNQGSLKKWIRALKKLLEENQPTGFCYIFPVNRLDGENERILGELKAEFPSVRITYYDCDSVDKLIGSLETVNSLPELVEYIKQARS